VLAWCGAIAGLAAPFTIGTYVVWGGRHRPGYDPWRDTMTELGDETDATARSFPIVNAVVAIELGVLALAIAGELPLRWLWVLVAITAIGSAIIGVTACERRCSRPGCTGVAKPWLPRLHLGAAAVNGLCIVLVPALTSFVLRNRDDFRSLRLVGYPMTAVAAVLTLPYLWATRRNRRARRDGTAQTAHAGLYERLLWIVGYGWVVTAAVSLLSDGVLWPTVALGGWLLVSLRYVLLPGWRDPSPEFDPDDCQANTIKSLADPNCGLLLVRRIDNRPRFLEQLAIALDGTQVGEGRLALRGAERAKNAPFAVTIGFSAKGLHHLDVPYRWNSKSVHDSFDEGMRSRSAILGDVDESAPARWDPGWRATDELHVALWIVADGFTSLQSARRLVEQAFPSTTPVVEEPTAMLRDVRGRSVEHFGFADGIGTPWIDRVHPRRQRNGTKPVRKGGGALTRRGSWRPVALGEFVLGHLDETGDIFPVPDPHEVFEGGTFMVVRKLEQDVEAFRDLARGDAAARLVGRHPDGRPLAVVDRPSSPPDEFTFANDPQGLSCPRQAHVRRANPRAAPGFQTTMTARRRLIRRGMPYGPPYVAGKEPPHGGRGLLFVAYNVRIVEQFEFIQSEWLNAGSAFGLGTDPDVIAGQWPTAERRTVAIDDGADRCLVTRVAPRLVRMRGGEYFFVPSLSGLRALVRLLRPSAGVG
jgi:Dyp-type peroxidase family